MFFLAMVLLGSVAIGRLPVSLFPVIEGERLYVQFNRQGSEQEFVERELLKPLLSRISGIADITSTRATIRGSGGQLVVEFEKGTDIKIREYELQRVASKLRREQPPNTTWINVERQSTDAFSTFVLNVAVAGDHLDLNTLYDIANTLIAPRIASVPGVGRVATRGGGRRQVNIEVDPDKVAALGLTTSAVSEAVSRRLGEVEHLGTLEDSNGITNLVIDGRVTGLESLGNTQLRSGSPVRLRHVANIEYGFAQKQSLFRVNAKPAVGITVYQEDSANLLEVGAAVRERVAEVQLEMHAKDVQLTVLDDQSETIDDQIIHLAELAFIGFGGALVVLFVFLRQWRAVVVVGVAVPISVLLALAGLYLLDFDLNLVTLAGLAISIGLIVDNSVVVYEAILRGAERGIPIEEATKQGLKRTVRAIVAASATTAVVFFPTMFVELDNPMFEQIIIVVAAALLLPIMMSLVVAVGLVPMLAHRLSAKAAVLRVAKNKQTRKERAGVLPPDSIGTLFSELSKLSLRYPAAWLTGVVIMVIVTLVVTFTFFQGGGGGDRPQNVDSVSLDFEVRDSRELDETAETLDYIEEAFLAMAGVESVVSQIESQGGSIAINLVDLDERPPELNASAIYTKATELDKEIRGSQLVGADDGGNANESRRRRMNFNSPRLSIALSGPSYVQIVDLGERIEQQLEEIEQVAYAYVEDPRGMPEIVVTPRRRVLETFGLHVADLMPVLNMVGSEGLRAEGNFSLGDGREIPAVMEREGVRDQGNKRSELREMRVNTQAGTVQLGQLANERVRRSSPAIVYEDGRNMARVIYRYTEDVPSSGAAKESIDAQVKEIVRNVQRPEGYSIEFEDSNQENVSIVSKFFVPILLFLFLILAITFESVILPVVVMLSLVLMAVGAMWFGYLMDQPLFPGGIAGILALFGIAVNPAILLVDRMQRKTLDSGWSAGAAAFSAVRERTRPVLLTTATTIAALMPLTISEGRENEFWPAFAWVMIGGLSTSALLTLLVVPVGYILLNRVDRIFGRIGPWLMVFWLVINVSIMSSLIYSELLESILWQVICGILIGGCTLGILAFVFRRRQIPEPDFGGSHPVLAVTQLHKIYGLPGPFSKAVQSRSEFVEKVTRLGGILYSKNLAGERLVISITALLALVGWGYYIQTGVGTLVCWLSASAVAAFLVSETARLQGLLDRQGHVVLGRLRQLIVMCLPWLAVVAYGFYVELLPYLKGLASSYNLFATIVVGIVLLALQLLRRSARQQLTGRQSPRATGSLRVLRTKFRKISRKFAGFDLSQQEIRALAGFQLTASQGMIGILGPNGAGKTTLLRQLAGILDPSAGSVKIGGVVMKDIRNYLARWIGYLPQDAGLPERQTPREFLQYFAALYELDPEIRDERVEMLLEEVGLADKAEEQIGSLSGGMRQRVAVARTLLRLPKIIIVDEPTVGLDPRERIRFRNFLSRLAQDRIVLFSTHVVEDVSVACDRVIVLNGGELQFDGEPNQLAALADGKVWETHSEDDTPPAIDENSILAAQAPKVDGGVICRILSSRPPSNDARALGASLEDGYLWLIGPSTSNA